MSAGARLHAVVHGYVQGVGFRYFILRRAREAGLVGWVRNCPDGAVECLAEGPRPALDRLLAEMRHGPRPAEVSEVDVEWQPASGTSGSSPSPGEPLAARSHEGRKEP